MKQTKTSAGKLSRLADFRQKIYDCLLRASDSLFELLDAVLITRSIGSFAELSLSVVFRRRWPSLYEALDDGKLDQAGIDSLLRQQMLEEQPDANQRLILAIDHTSWARVQSYSLSDRGFHHKAEAVPGNRPITIGYGFSTIAWLPQAEMALQAEAMSSHDSWSLPLVHQRIASTTTPLSLGIEQLTALFSGLGTDGDRVLLLGDSEYASAGFVKAVAALPGEKLFRLRPNRVLRGVPEPYKGRGRPAKHGKKFKLKYPSSWPEPVAQELFTTTAGTQIRLRRWSQLHFREAAGIDFDILLVERLGEDGTPKDAMWLLWLGSPLLAMQNLWRVYLRRFGIEHWYRFAKQRLHWTEPKFSTPERCQTWSSLMPLGQWQLYLAREVVSDSPLPWQKPQTTPTPGRVAEGFSGVIAEIGTPARKPKPRGKSPGWALGRPRTPRQQHKVKRKTKPKGSSKQKVPS